MSAIRELQKQLLTLRSQLAAKERECEELRTSLQEMCDYGPGGMVNPSDDAVYQEVKHRARNLLRR